MPVFIVLFDGRPIFRIEAGSVKSAEMLLSDDVQGTRYRSEYGLDGTVTPLVDDAFAVAGMAFESLVYEPEEVEYAINLGLFI